jgi:serine/threonine-protein phosphatase 4 catalytic subunit
MKLDDDLHREFLTFEAAPASARGVPAKKPIPDYFL